MNIQPTIQTNKIIIQPIQASDFDRLYAVASDPKVWEQHPNPLRYQREVFANYFEGAIASKGALLIIDAEKKQVIGASRYYDFDEAQKSILIGYTFFGTAYWGGVWNPMVKQLMIDYAFTFVDKVIFHIGADNIRSQTAIGRLGAIKYAEEKVAYFGEGEKLNYFYAIAKADWVEQQKAKKNL
jgi:N-acetyltransferase